MMLKLENPLLIPKLLELSKIVPEVPLDTLEKMLLSGINNKDSIIYIDDKNGDINGFIYASKEKWDGEDVAFIQLCVIKPNGEEKYIGFELLTKIKLWAKEKGLKNIITVVRRNPDGFIKKYHFKLNGYILKKGVEA